LTSSPNCSVQQYCDGRYGEASSPGKLRLLPEVRVRHPVGPKGIVEGRGAGCRRRH
jgi:hypothetical protein